MLLFVGFSNGLVDPKSPGLFELFDRFEPPDDEGDDDESFGGEEVLCPVSESVPVFEELDDGSRLPSPIASLLLPLPSADAVGVDIASSRPAEAAN